VSEHEKNRRAIDRGQLNGGPAPARAADKGVLDSRERRDFYESALDRDPVLDGPVAPVSCPRPSASDPKGPRRRQRRKRDPVPARELLVIPGYSALGPDRQELGPGGCQQALGVLRGQIHLIRRDLIDLAHSRWRSVSDALFRSTAGEVTEGTVFFGPGARRPLKQSLESLRRRVGRPDQQITIRRQKDVQGPAHLTDGALDKANQVVVQGRIQLPIELHRDEIPVEPFGDPRIMEALALHHMTPNDRRSSR